MKKNLVLIAAILTSLMGMGLASRDGRLHAEQRGAPGPYDAHLKYYEQIRPVLLGALLANGLLCNGSETMER